MKSTYFPGQSSETLGDGPSVTKDPTTLSVNAERGLLAPWRWGGEEGTCGLGSRVGGVLCQKPARCGGRRRWVGSVLPETQKTLAVAHKLQRGHYFDTPSKLAHGWPACPPLITLLHRSMGQSRCLDQHLLWDRLNEYSARGWGLVSRDSQLRQGFCPTSPPEESLEEALYSEITAVKEVKVLPVWEKTKPAERSLPLQRETAKGWIILKRNSPSWREAEGAERSRAGAFTAGNESIKVMHMMHVQLMTAGERFSFSELQRQAAKAGLKASCWSQVKKQRHTKSNLSPPQAHPQTGTCQSELIS